MKEDGRVYAKGLQGIGGEGWDCVLVIEKVSGPGGVRWASAAAVLPELPNGFAVTLLILDGLCLAPIFFIEGTMQIDGIMTDIGERA